MIPIEPLDIKSHIPEMPDLDEIINDIINFFNSTPVLPLPLEERFDGAGVYALYYKGEFDLYKPITEANSSKFVQPIYVGKAVPKGWIKGRTKKQKKNNQELYDCILEKTKRINAAINLNINDFYCRLVILEGLSVNLIDAVENFLIQRYRPLWNCCIDGF